MSFAEEPSRFARGVLGSATNLCPVRKRPGAVTQHTSSVGADEQAWNTLILTRAEKEPPLSSPQATLGQALHVVSAPGYIYHRRNTMMSGNAILEGALVSRIGEVLRNRSTGLIFPYYIV